MPRRRLEPDEPDPSEHRCPAFYIERKNIDDIWRNWQCVGPLGHRDDHFLKGGRRTWPDPDNAVAVRDTSWRVEEKQKKLARRFRYFPVGFRFSEDHEEFDPPEEEVPDMGNGDEELLEPVVVDSDYGGIGPLAYGAIVALTRAVNGLREEIEGLRRDITRE